MGKGGGVEIPSEYTTHIDSNGTAFVVDADLDDIHIKEFPKIRGLGDINVRLKEIPKEIPKLTVDTNLAVTKLPPIDTNISVKEIPEIKFALTSLPDTRVHLPANFNEGCRFSGSACSTSRSAAKRKSSPKSTCLAGWNSARGTRWPRCLRRRRTPTRARRR